MMQTLHKIKIEGFKSIENAEIELGDLNVVIGANGSGKSNLIEAFDLFKWVLKEYLPGSKLSEPDRYLFHGRKVSPELSLSFDFGGFTFELTLHAEQDNLCFKTLPGIHLKAEPSEARPTPEEFSRIWKNTLMVYHFEDTSKTSPARLPANLDDNRFLRPNAANLPAYLYWLQEKHPVAFRHIEEHIRLVAPFFDRFLLAPSRLNENKIKLEWQQKGSDAYFDAWSLSDGTLRFICLATLLLQPNPPALILLDEPELGLHPFAIRILAEMLEAASKRVQVLVATQSVTLLNHFAPKDIIVAENDGRKSLFKRLDEDQLKDWLDQFSIGELWEKNVLGGRP